MSLGLQTKIVTDPKECSCDCCCQAGSRRHTDICGR